MTAIVNFLTFISDYLLEDQVPLTDMKWMPQIKFGDNCMYTSPDIQFS